MRIDPADHEVMSATLRPRRQGRPWLQLLNAVLALAGEHATLLGHTETTWASITFSGSRHAVSLEFVGNDGADAAERFIEALPDHEFAIPRRLVADATIVAVRHVMVPERRIAIDAELLLLDEA
jgi:hypothetical protein